MIGTNPRFCLWWLHLTGISSIILYPQCWEFWQKHENTIRWRRARLAVRVLTGDTPEPFIDREYSKNFKSHSLYFLLLFKHRQKRTGIQICSRVLYWVVRVVHISNSTICWSDCKKWGVNVKMMKDCG